MIDIRIYTFFYKVDVRFYKILFFVHLLKIILFRGWYIVPPINIPHLHPKYTMNLEKNKKLHDHGCLFSTMRLKCIFQPASRCNTFVNLDIKRDSMVQWYDSRFGCERSGVRLPAETIQYFPFSMANFVNIFLFFSFFIFIFRTF